MPSRKTNRSAVRCHPMSTRSTAGWREQSSSSGSSASDSSPDNSPARVRDTSNPSRKRRRDASESEEPEDSSSITRPMKKLNISKRRSETDADSDDGAEMSARPSQPEDETDGGDAVPVPPVLPVVPLPTLHLRSDGFWPTIRDNYLRSLEDESIRVDIPCVVCGDECIVDGQEHWARRRPEGAGRELPVILCCGHMIGDECLEEWRHTRRREGEEPNCPICRMSLECSNCGGTMPGWPLTQGIPMGDTRTLRQGGHRVARCNSCEAQDRFGEAMRLSYPDAGGRLDEPRALQAWFDAARNRAAAEVREGRYGSVAARDIADRVLNATLLAMGERLTEFQEEVRGRVQETLQLIEQELDLRLPWNHAAEEEEEQEEDDDDDDWWIENVFP
ncbi:hypothetical protein LX32DRAFT_725106 [Colletotrichum zoysiae]|uniref:RING-type domain-containing protein n=1 Tax=Colletotrichum zoysiae TaxID=1216348 RepID=A0AAD9HTD8_9PEZI|nr:hypothetical protein LX32DRAFT_725106 [Colletotrichum zoysiae]